VVGQCTRDIQYSLPLFLVSSPAETRYVTKNRPRVSTMHGITTAPQALRAKVLMNWMAIGGCQVPDAGSLRIEGQLVDLTSPGILRWSP
jgi:hypothetical protein